MKKYFRIGLIVVLFVLLAAGPFGFYFAEAKCSFPFGGICEAFADLITIPLLLSSWILWLAGVLLNAVLQFTVVDLAQNLSGITGINIAWGVIRDVANMAFIFILLYIAIGTILGLEKVNWKKTLVGIIIAALLINFSLFFTKLIIDASNIVAVLFYERIAPIANPSGRIDIFGSGLSNSFMQPLGLTSFFDPTQGGKILEQVGNDFGKLATISFGGSAFFVVLAFVFLAVSIMFLIRYVNFIFLLILSPVVFLRAVLPGGWGEKVSNFWSSKLTGEAVFAPLYMILTWVVLTVISSSVAQTGISSTPAGSVTTSTSVLASSLSGIAGGGAGGAAQQGTFGLVMNFVIVIIFAVATLIISKTVAGQAGSVGEKIMGKVLGGAVGTAGFVGRQTIGRAASKFAESEWLRKRAPESRLARLTLGTSKAIAKGGFDVRTPLGKVGEAVGAGDLGIGKAGGKGGYEAFFEKQVKRREELGKEFKRVSDVEVHDKAKSKVLGAKLKRDFDLDISKNQLNQARRQAAAIKQTNPAQAKKMEDAAQEKYKADASIIEERYQKEITDARSKARIETEREGKERARQYAEHIERRTFWSPLVSRKHKVAAEKIRKDIKEKTTGDKLKEIIDEEVKKQVAAAAPPPAGAPPGAAPTTPPAAPPPAGTTPGGSPPRP
ncbi:hypothetical protein EPN83_03490 [Patescibacteria group bacterium]|nr:MAG: hypothetical protein EPN83_03490 [Patescibacteria group bacterium]